VLHLDIYEQVVDRVNPKDEHPFKQKIRIKIEECLKIYTCVAILRRAERPSLLIVNDIIG
jgi:hypothetical protein